MDLNCSLENKKSVDDFGNYILVRKTGLSMLFKSLLNLLPESFKVLFSKMKI